MQRDRILPQFLDMNVYSTYVYDSRYNIMYCIEYVVGSQSWLINKLQFFDLRIKGSFWLILAPEGYYLNVPDLEEQQVLSK